MLEERCGLRSETDLGVGGGELRRIRATGRGRAPLHSQRRRPGPGEVLAETKENVQQSWLPQISLTMTMTLLMLCFSKAMRIHFGALQGPGQTPLACSAIAVVREEKECGKRREGGELVGTRGVGWFIQILLIVSNPAPSNPNTLTPSTLRSRSLGRDCGQHGIRVQQFGGSRGGTVRTRHA